MKTHQVLFENANGDRTKLRHNRKRISWHYLGSTLIENIFGRNTVYIANESRYPKVAFRRTGDRKTVTMELKTPRVGFKNRTPQRSQKSNLGRDVTTKNKRWRTTRGPRKFGLPVFAIE